VKSPDEGYQPVVQRFAALGQRIIRTDPREHYTEIGRNAKRALEPGYIPIEKPPRVVTVSYYPNETELKTPQFDALRRSFDAWGRSGSVEDYETSYMDWLQTLPQIPFHRDWNVPVFREVGIENHEFAWLPLVKCPLPAYSVIPDYDIFRDRMLLWEQISLLRPAVIIAQGQSAHDVVRPMCEDKFPHRIVYQKIARVGTNAYHTAEQERVVRQLRDAFDRAK